MSSKSSNYSDAQRRACKKYYDTHREKRLELAKEYSKKKYVPVVKKSKEEYRKEFVEEVIPLIEEHLSKQEDQRLINPTFNEKTYLNFRKTILIGSGGTEPLEEVFVSIDHLGVHQRAWFYKKSQWKKKKGEMEYRDWIVVDYGKYKN